MPRLSANSCSGVSLLRELEYTGGGVKTDFRDGVFNDLLVCHIALVTDEQLVHTLCGVTVDFLQPLLDVVEAVHVGDIVNDTDAVCAAVVGRSDGPEAFLAGRIPL